MAMAPDGGHQWPPILLCFRSKPHAKRHPMPHSSVHTMLRMALVKVWTRVAQTAEKGDTVIVLQDV